MSKSPPCPKCKSEFAYTSDDLLICPECFNERNPKDEVIESSGEKVFDSNGNELQDGDTVIIIKDLPVKGAPKPNKMGTKVKNIRLTSIELNIDCKVDGFRAMA